jgi:hypothetical protein
MTKYIKKYSFLPLSWRLLWATFFGKYSLFLFSSRINWEHGFLFTESGHHIRNVSMAGKTWIYRILKDIFLYKKCKVYFPSKLQRKDYVQSKNVDAIMKCYSQSLQLNVFILTDDWYPLLPTLSSLVVME